MAKSLYFTSCKIVGGEKTEYGNTTANSAFRVFSPMNGYRKWKETETETECSQQTPWKISRGWTKVSGPEEKRFKEKNKKPVMVNFECHLNWTERPLGEGKAYLWVGLWKVQTGIIKGELYSECRWHCPIGRDPGGVNERGEKPAATEILPLPPVLHHAASRLQWHKQISSAMPSLPHWSESTK